MLMAGLLISCSTTAMADATSDFSLLLAEHWEAHLANNPLESSRNGDRRFNDQWSDQSLNAIERRHLQAKEFLKRVYAINRSELSEDDQLNYELFRRQLQDSVDAHQFAGHLLPFGHQGGVSRVSQSSLYCYSPSAPRVNGVSSEHAID